MNYKISEQLKTSITNEIKASKGFNRMVVFKAMAKEVFPTLKSCALLTDKVELFNFD